MMNYVQSSRGRYMDELKYKRYEQAAEEKGKREKEQLKLSSH